MPLPRWIAHLNRAAFNKVTRRFAASMPGFAIVIHKGRRSGKVYRTPVNVFQRRNGVTVALTYGTEADWVRNVLAARGCEIAMAGRREQLSNPRIVHDPSLHRASPVARPLLRLVGVADFMELMRSSPNCGST